MTRVKVKPELFRWARNRAGYSITDLSNRFKKLTQWERGESVPTLKQLEAFAKAVFVPVGYLFLSSPPEERLPVPDLRTVGSQGVRNPSPDLLDTIYLCQRRQDWFHEYAMLTKTDPLPFIGSVTIKSPPVAVAEKIRQTIQFDLKNRKHCPTWAEALRDFFELVDEAGILVMCSGVVGNNNKRVLDIEEFRGFALIDSHAPLIFINGTDTKSAQMFTLAHELAHIWLGQGGVSDSNPGQYPSQQIEQWCNAVAAELLVPEKALLDEVSPNSVPHDIKRLARCFKVSTLVILRRLWDTNCINQKQFQEAYRMELARIKGMPKSSGGNFFLTLGARAGKRFTRSLVISTFEGQTSFVEAMRLLGINKVTALHEIGRRVGVPL